MKQSAKNTTIELFRIFFSCIIALHHFRGYSSSLPFGGGYMATDFFFILSGVFFYRALKKYMEQKTYKNVFLYIKNKYFRFEKYVIISECCLIVASLSYWKLEKNEFIRELLLWELFVPDSGKRFNAPLWYLGYLLIGMVFLAMLFVSAKQDSKTIFIISTIIVGFVYSVVLLKNGNGNIYPHYKTIINLNAIIRCLCGLLVGTFISILQMEKSFSIKFEKLFLIVFLFVDAYYLLWKDGYTNKDLIIYIILIINVFFMINSKYEIRNNALNKIIIKMGEVSFLVYIIHFPIVRIISNQNLFKDLDWKIYSFLFLFLVWAIAWIENYFINLSYSGVKNKES